MYTIDLTTMLQLLHEFGKSGTLQAHLPMGVSGFKDDCYAAISVTCGDLTACHIKSSAGRIVLPNEQALQYLYSVGRLHWVFSERQEDPPSLSANFTQISTLSDTIPALLPRRTAEAAQMDISLWPRNHKRVFVLIDGTRTLEKIAAMLALYPQGVAEIQTILRDLQAAGLVVLDQ